MARIKGVLGQVEGSMDELNFYKRSGSSYVRKKGGVSGERIANDPEFKRTRENGAEFGMLAGAGKLVRVAFQVMVQASGGTNLAARLVKTLNKVKQADVTSIRGKRSVGVGIQTPEGKGCLKGFEFNPGAPFTSIVTKPVTLNAATGVMTLANLKGAQDLAFPPGATHAVFQAAWAKVDFELMKSETAYSNVVRVPLDTTTQNVVLTPDSVPAMAGISFFAMSLKFEVETNGQAYSLNNQGFNALRIVDVV